MAISISDHAEEFRIEISGRFSGTPVEEASAAWRSALSDNTPRRISVDITRMTGYDRLGYTLLRNIYLHGTNMPAGTPNSLRFLAQISAHKPVADLFSEVFINRRQPSAAYSAVQVRAAASGK